jgi:hypothetical protein
MAYQYKMTQVPDNTKDVASHLQTLANQETQGGWEFYRVDTIGIASNPGCLGSLFGQKESYQQHFVVTFRKSV